MRTILAILNIFLYIIILFPCQLYAKWLKKTSSIETSYAFTYKIARSWTKSLLKACGTKLTVSGLENIPDDQAVLFVGNHQSYFDIVSLVAVIEKPVGFVAKTEIQKIPIFSTWVSLIGSVFIDRKDLRQSLKAIIEASENLKQGHNMVIFPEGTRNASNELLPFKKGSFKPAQKSGSPIIPVAINGTRQVFEAQKGLKVKSTDVHISFGAPIILSVLTKEEKANSGDYIKNIIEDMLQKKGE